MGIRSVPELERSPFLGTLFEGFIAAEILKSQVNRGLRKELYYFRDQQGLEVDFLVPRPNAGLWLIEAKAGETVHPGMAAPLLSLERALGKKSSRLIVVHRKTLRSPGTSAIARDVDALDVEHFVKKLTPGGSDVQPASSILQTSISLESVAGVVPGRSSELDDDMSAWLRVASVETIA